MTIPHCRIARAALGLALLISTSQFAEALLAAPPPLPRSNPQDAGLDEAHLRHIDDVVAQGIAEGEMPGCVVAIGRRGKLVFLKAYGDRQIEPTKAPMTVDTLFDMASITKPVATATSVMILVEQGKLRLRDRASSYIPEFGENGKREITIEQLLTHQSGLIPDNALADYEEGAEEAYRRVHALSPKHEPGTRFVYSDVGFIVLGKLVERASGKDVNQFSQEHIFTPLGMRDTGYLPREELHARAAPTEQRDGAWMQGEVHDPRSYLMGGVAGHAGLFSTAEDLAVYAQMMLQGGRYGDVRILGQPTVDLMTAPYEVSSGIRGLGWDKKTGYSSNRGENFSPRAFGHGGFTGTVLWIDPELDMFLIFLSNRLHPDGKGTVNALAGRIGTIAAGAIRPDDNVTGGTGGLSTRDPSESPQPLTNNRPAPPNTQPVLTGIDVLQRDNFAQLKDRRVGLITNQTGINRAGVSTAKLLAEAPEVNLVALFSPEHGLEGKLDIPRIGDTNDSETGLKVHSLYGETRRPTAESLKDLDTLVFDIQDIGCRFYTYVSTMGNAMQAAAEHDVRFVVLDRPNPIGGVAVAGPVLDAGSESFVGFHPIAVQHGMTVGELAQMFKAELNLDLDLQVIQVEGWRRGELFDATGLRWINPSPNMRNLNQAVLYPGVGLVETTNLSVGRGTDTPFELFGAPWIDGEQLARELNSAGLAGVRFVPIRFTPDASKFKDEECGGVNILITERARLDALRLGMEIACALRKLYPDDWKTDSYNRLLADEATFDLVKNGAAPADIEAAWQPELRAFLERRQKVLLYD